MLMTAIVYTFVAAFVAIAIVGHFLVAAAVWPSLRIFQRGENENSSAPATIDTVASEDDAASVDDAGEIASVSIHKAA